VFKLENHEFWVSTNRYLCLNFIYASVNMKFLLLAFSVVASGLEWFADDWQAVPGGYMYHKSCIKTVPSGTTLSMESVGEDSCKYKPMKDPRRQFYPIQANYSPQHNGVVTQMNTTFVVPGLPTARSSATVYLWPGFKGSEPVIGYPVLQPVLEWHGSNWILRSWLVGVGSAVNTKPINVRAGDSLPTYMALKSTEWTVYGIDSRSGETAILKVTKERAGKDYNWAVQVMETIVPEGDCSYYPSTGGIKFTGITVNNDATPIKMTCAVHDTTCNQKCSSDAGSVTFTWKN